MEYNSNPESLFNFLEYALIHWTNLQFFEFGYGISNWPRIRLASDMDKCKTGGNCHILSRKLESD